MRRCSKVKRRKVISFWVVKGFIMRDFIIICETIFWGFEKRKYVGRFRR